LAGWKDIRLYRMAMNTSQSRAWASGKSGLREPSRVDTLGFDRASARFARSTGAAAPSSPIGGWKFIHRQDNSFARELISPGGGHLSAARPGRLKKISFSPIHSYPVDPVNPVKSLFSFLQPMGSKPGRPAAERFISKGQSRALQNVCRNRRPFPAFQRSSSGPSMIASAR
jgi:hypothetical protein